MLALAVSYSCVGVYVLHMVSDLLDTWFAAIAMPELEDLEWPKPDAMFSLDLSG